MPDSSSSASAGSSGAGGSGSAAHSLLDPGNVAGAGRVSLPSATVRFGGNKEAWPIFKKRFLAWLSAERLNKFMLQPLPALAAGSAAVSSAAAAAESPAEKTRILDAVADEAAAEKWHQKASVVYYGLMQSLHGPQMDALLETSPDNDPHSLWKKLVAKYESTSVANQSKLWSTLHGARMGNDESISEFANRLRKIEGQLRGLGATVDPTQLKHLLLDGVTVQRRPRSRLLSAAR